MKTKVKSKITQKSNKRSIIAAMLLFVLMLSMSSMAYASSYSTYVKFKNPYAGATREFTGDDIRYSATMKSDKKNDTGKYTVYLQRESGIWALDVGEKECKRVGYSKVDWSNVGSGKYRLYFYKTSDGVTLSSDDVVIKNY